MTDPSVPPDVADGVVPDAEKQARRPMDESYKRFFSHVIMVRHLLEGFAAGGWMEQVDFETLEPVPGSFITDLTQQRHCDVIWRVRWRETGRWIYLYLLIEFQSRPTRLMPARLMVYEGLILLAAAKLPEFSGEEDLLPGVVAICVYNGKGRWDKPLRLSRVTEPLPGDLRHLQADLAFLLLDMGDHEEDELAAKHNLVATLFRLENSRTPAEAARGIRALNDELVEAGDSEVEESFDTWLDQILQRKFPTLDISDVRGREGKTMLAENLERWYEKTVEAGRQEGEVNAQQRTLLQLLGKRFGPLDDDVRERILAIRSPDELMRHIERILEVSSLDEFLTGI